jgi:dTDP-4-dehydrorhamnose 3,5-epimerase
MIFREVVIDGAYLIEPKRIEDERGFFARIWCQDELQQMGLRTDLVQANVGFSSHRGTLRGLHLQQAPHAEVKIVRCTRGAIFDVIVDLRPNSRTYKRWFGTELNEENRKMLYVPEGCAQGYITLVDRTEMYYHTTERYAPELASGVRFDDPEFQIAWPLSPSMMSHQDKNWPDYTSRVQQLVFT